MPRDMLVAQTGIEEQEAVQARREIEPIAIGWPMVPKLSNNGHELSWLPDRQGVDWIRTKQFAL